MPRYRRSTVHEACPFHRRLLWVCEVAETISRAATCLAICRRTRVPADHPLRPIRQMTGEALRRLSPRFDAIYATSGRPSVPPEQRLRALLLRVLYSIRSERLLMERLLYLLFRWFVGLGMDDMIWTPTTFSKNRERLLDGDCDF